MHLSVRMFVCTLSLGGLAHKRRGKFGEPIEERLASQPVRGWEKEEEEFSIRVLNIFGLRKNIRRRERENNAYRVSYRGKYIFSQLNSLHTSTVTDVTN